MTCSNCYDTDSWEYLAPDETTGTHELDGDKVLIDPTDPLDDILWDLYDRDQIQLVGDAAPIEPPYPFCTGYPTKADCAKRGYCAREIACDN